MLDADTNLPVDKSTRESCLGVQTKQIAISYINSSIVDGHQALSFYRITAQYDKC